MSDKKHIPNSLTELPVCCWFEKMNKENKRFLIDTENCNQTKKCVENDKEVLFYK